MKEDFKTKEEEIEDSLDFCKDIAIYYKNESSNSSSNKNTYKTPYSYSGKPAPAFAEGSAIFSVAGEEGSEQLDVKKMILSNIVHLLICVIIAAVLSKVINTYLLQQAFVDGTSMETQLHNGDHLLMSKLSYKIGTPDRFDIVIFPFEEDVCFVKRVIGLPGETIQIIDGYVYIDGNLLQDDTYCKDLIENPGVLSESYVIGNDEVFVMGDNRNNSLDSRFSAVGTIKIKDILGKAFFRIYPFENFGKVK